MAYPGQATAGQHRQDGGGHGDAVQQRAPAARRPLEAYLPLNSAHDKGSRLLLGGVEDVWVDKSQVVGQWRDLGVLGAARGAPVQMRSHPAGLGLAEVTQHEGSEQLAQLTVPWVVSCGVGHGVTSISSIATRKA
jgi:hypothetical protein